MGKRIANFGINFQTLNNKEFSSLLAKNNAKVIEQLSDKAFGKYKKRVLLLDDGRVILDILGPVYEFKDMLDYSIFNSAINKVLEKESSALYLDSIDIFIEQYDHLKNELKKEYGLASYDIVHLKDIHKVFTSLSDKKLLVIVFCEILLANIKDSYLKILSMGGREQIVVVSTPDAIYSPADVLIRQKNNESTWVYIEDIVGRKN